MKTGMAVTDRIDAMRIGTREYNEECGANREQSKFDTASNSS